MSWAFVGQAMTCGFAGIGCLASFYWAAKLEGRYGFPLSLAAVASLAVVWLSLLLGALV